jgi:hypothetical protein
VPFVINRDVSTADGAIRCRELTASDLSTVGWRLLRLIKILRDFPIPF